jgi:hypothetical protein
MKYHNGKGGSIKVPQECHILLGHYSTLYICEDEIDMLIILPELIKYF